MEYRLEIRLTADSLHVDLSSFSDRDSIQAIKRCPANPKGDGGSLLDTLNQQVFLYSQAKEALASKDFEGAMGFLKRAQTMQGQLIARHPELGSFFSPRGTSATDQ